jgi:aspartate aminotransferase
MTRGISSMVGEIQPSATLSLKEEVSSLEKKYGFKIIDLTAGQPDTGPTQDVLEALVEGGRLHKYGPVQGDTELREVLPSVLSEEVGVKYEPKDIAITIGAKGAIDILMRVLLNPGDRVGIMSPFWVTYPESVRVAHGVPYFLECITNLRPDTARLPAELKANNIKVLLYSSPCNPSGVVYTMDELEAMARVMKEQDIWVISDEIYRNFVFDDRAPASMLQVEGMRDNTILVDGPSKRFGIPGWRLGIVAGPSEVIKALVKLQGHTSSGASRPVQHAVRIAYTSQEAKRASAEMRRRYQRNRDIFAEGLDGIDGFSCAMPEGAFYAFPNIAKFFGRRYRFDGSEYVVDGSTAFRTFVLRKAQVAGVEGAPFGMDDHIRFSLATKEEDCVSALASIRNAVRELD